jgi:iron complex outermembrane receptor protein
VKSWELSLLSKYVSRQYLDNTGNKARMLGAYYVQDFRTIYTVHKLVFREISFMLQVNNIFNTLYEPNGYTYSYIYGGEMVNENYYFPMAGTNFMVGVNVKL